MQQSVYIVSLGCDKNRIDAEIMASSLERAGFLLCADPREADCALVNTCGFIESAKKEAIDAIFEMVAYKQDPAARMRAVVVTGCLAQRYREEVMELIPELDAVCGISFNDDIEKTVADALAGKLIERFGAPELLRVEGERLVSTPGHYAYVKIAEGCSNHCTYCAIPGIRGRYRSRPIENVVQESKQLVQNGTKELLLVAQDTTAYGSDTGEGDLADLLERLAQIKGLWKIHVLYAYPERITDKLLETIARHGNIAKYLDIPLQHANSDVLKRMGRPGSAAQLLELIEKIRETVPGIALRSTFIVGFPGETQAQFDELLDFLKAAKLERAGCFAYSAEDGTPAAKLPDQLDEQTKQQRADAFMRVQSNILAADRARFVGRELEAIVDGFDDETGLYVCRSEYDIPDVDTVMLVESSNELERGAVVKPVVTGTDGCDLFAEL